MERAINLNQVRWRVAADASAGRVQLFAAAVLTCMCLCAALAGWLPLPVSIVTVFLFAGPHNWFEFRYFLMRLPARLGRSRKFFLLAFAGIGLLTVCYVGMPLAYYGNLWSGVNWPTTIAVWNTLLLLWLAALVWLRGRQKARRDWSWVFPV